MVINSERRNHRKLLGILQELGHDQYWRHGVAMFPVTLPEARHHVSIYMVKREVNIWGLSGLIFIPGRVPPGVTRGLFNRNARLEDIQWTTCTGCGRELFAVTATRNIKRLNAALLDDLISRVVHELEFCRRVLEYLKAKAQEYE